MDTEGGGEAGTSESQSRRKKGHMTNICLTDSDEEAIVVFVRKLTRCSRTRPGSIAFWRGLQAAATCQ